MYYTILTILFVSQNAQSQTLNICNDLIMCWSLWLDTNFINWASFQAGGIIFYHISVVWQHWFKITMVLMSKHHCSSISELDKDELLDWLKVRYTDKYINIQLKHHNEKSRMSAQSCSINSCKWHAHCLLEPQGINLGTWQLTEMIY